MHLSSEEKKRFKRLEKSLGYAFKSRAYLKRALTHKSYANEQRLPSTEHNERYEYLGDAVLELAISHLLMERFPHHTEGDLSKLRAAVVNESRLADIARRLELGPYLLLGKGEEMTGGRDKPSLLSDAYEAVLGAVYLDRGFAKAYGTVSRHFSGVLDRADDSGFMSDFKTRLQEVAQGRFHAMPRYRLIRESGPDHQKIFEVHLFINDDLMGIGKGNSKKAAEQAAAREALDVIENGGSCAGSGDRR